MALAALTRESPCRPQPPLPSRTSRSGRTRSRCTPTAHLPSATTAGRCSSAWCARGSSAMVRGEGERAGHGGGDWEGGAQVWGCSLRGGREVMGLWEEGRLGQSGDKQRQNWQERSVKILIRRNWFTGCGVVGRANQLPNPKSSGGRSASRRVILPRLQPLSAGRIPSSWKPLS